MAIVTAVVWLLQGGGANAGSLDRDWTVERTGEASAAAIPVAADTVRRGTLTLEVSATGQAEADRRAQLAAPVSGHVASVTVDEGDAVVVGEVLVVLDPREASLGVERAKTNLAEAEARFREQSLFDEEISDPRIRSDRSAALRARSGLARAEIELREAQGRLAATRIRAPFAGRVAEVDVAAGERVAEGEHLITVIDLDPIRVEIRVVESEIRWLGEGVTASIQLIAFPDTVFHARVSSISPIVDPEHRTGRVTVIVPNPDGAILPGMYARVALQGRAFADLMFVPEDAIIERDGRTLVFLFEPLPGAPPGEGRAKWVYVSTGLSDGRRVEILEDAGSSVLKSGDLVLTAGHLTLVHDAKVRVDVTRVTPR